MLETVNITGWKGLRRRLRTSKAHVLLVQETWVDKDFSASASQWASRRGWKSCWCPAERREGGGVAAGTAIFAKDWPGLRYPPKCGYQWHESRACAAVVDVPGYRPLLVAAVYCHHGQGASAANVALLTDVIANFRAQGEGWSLILGADFNMEPRQLIESGLPAELGTVVIAPTSPRGTCRTRTAARTYDYYMAAGEISGVTDDIRIVEGSGNRTHTPVQLALKPRAAALKALHLRAPPRLPTERVYGPLPPPPEWEKAQPAFEAAVEAARKEPRKKAEAALTTAYALWAHMAEEELADATGESLAKAGTRSQRPHLAWRSVLPEQRPPEGYPSAAALAWLKDLGRELARSDGGATARKAAAGVVRQALSSDAPGGTPCEQVEYAIQQLKAITKDIDDYMPPPRRARLRRKPRLHDLPRDHGRRRF